MPRKPASKPAPKQFTLKLSSDDLTHLRDLFTVSIPKGDKLGKSISQTLASPDRSSDEQALWKKITTLCKEAKVPTGENAPDFVVGMSEAPELGVFQVVTDRKETKK